MEWKSYTHPISDVRDWNRNKRLELRPDFQRNEVWSHAAQIMLIDTILKNIPIPKMYIKSIINEGNTYRIVIDGQQRLTAILKFVEDRLRLGKPYIGDYEGMKFSELPDTIQNDILRYTIDINEIFNPTEAEIRDLYARVNKYTVQLNKQELRKADFPGDFINISEELSNNPFYDTSGIFTPKQRRRMVDVEFVEELLAIVLEGIQDKKDNLDNLCEKYMDMTGLKEDAVSIFSKAILDIESIFEETEYPIKPTRFKQKADFYSLFGCIVEFVCDGKTIDSCCLSKLRNALSTLDKEIEPHSESEPYRNYALHCVSDANSINSRKWRIEFLRDYLKIVYEPEVN